MNSRATTGARAGEGATGDLFADVVVPAPVQPPATAPARKQAVARAPVLAPVADAAPVAGTAPRHLWLALRLPLLPVHVLAPGPVSSPAAPLAVVEGVGARRLVMACDAQAARQGIRPGLKLNAAFALVPELDVRERAPLLEERCLQTLARWATRYTPFVSLEPPDTLLLEVRASLRLFGGAQALVERALAELAAQGHAAAHALAPAPRAALWLARGAPGTRVATPALLAGALGRLSPACTGWPPLVHETLGRLGVRTLGELRRLPRDGLARRFERAVLAELDEAFGQASTPRRRHVSPERFQERVELSQELDTVAHLQFAFDRLLERMAHFLRVRNAGVARLAIAFSHRDAKPTCVVLGRATPCGELAEWRLLLRERLDRVQLPAPVRAVALRTAVALPLPGASLALQGLAQPHETADAWTLLDRLRARLGDAAVNGVCVVPEHRPEAAWRRVRPAPTPVRGRQAATRARTPPLEALPLAPRPLWLLAVPERLRVRDGQPQYEGRLRIESGPERIESGWWDGDDVVRDYYVAATRGGSRLWIYREPRLGGAETHWFLHGVFG